MFDVFKEFDATGLDKDGLYVGTVINNNDPRKLQRVTVRLDGDPFAGIPDEHLPWAVPGQLGHPDGASPTSGTVDVPRQGTKVLIRFLRRSPDHPIYYSYLNDEKTHLTDGDLNYPNRKVYRLHNNTLVVIDTATDSIYIRSPGNTNLYIQGDLHITVDGNLVEHIKGNKRVMVDGNLVETVGGDRVLGVQGNDTALAGGNRLINTLGTDGHHAGGDMLRTAPYINDDLPVGDLGQIPAPEQVAPWPGISGQTP